MRDCNLDLAGQLRGFSIM